MINHPNFPPCLLITPNPSDKLQKHASGGICRDVFGIEAQQEAISTYGIAGRVWEAAYALYAYINPTKDDQLDFDPPFVDDSRLPLGVIELGSGTGIVAASVVDAIQSADRPGSLVIATDLPEVCPLLEHNLGIDVSHKVDGFRLGADAFVRPLTWGNLDHTTSITSEFGFGEQRRLSHIICSDLVYFPELFGPLLRSLLYLTSSPCVGSAKIVISYKIRSLSKEIHFWTAFGLWFSFYPALMRPKVDSFRDENGRLDAQSGASASWRQIGAEEDTDRTFVFVAHRRPESFTWRLPETDQELMDGVGSRGTTAKKGDDTFETILLMAMGIDNTSE